MTTSRREFLRFSLVGLGAGALALADCSPHTIVTEVPVSKEYQRKKYPYLGGRADKPEELIYCARIGAANVRIAGKYEELLNPESDFFRTIETASQYGLNPLVVYAPFSLPDEGIVNSGLKSILPFLHNGAVEILNEPDDPQIRWEKKDMFLAATLIKYVYDTVARENSNVKLVIGALKDIENNLPILITAMKNLGLEPTQFAYAVHGYQNSQEISTNINRLRNTLQSIGITNPELIVTETGVNPQYPGTDPFRSRLEILEEIVTTAFNLGVSSVYIHETKGINHTDKNRLQAKWSLTEDEMDQFYNEWVKPRISMATPTPELNSTVPPGQEFCIPASLLALLVPLLVLMKRISR